MTPKFQLKEWRIIMNNERVKIHPGSLAWGWGRGAVAGPLMVPDKVQKHQLQTCSPQLPNIETDPRDTHWISQRDYFHSYSLHLTCRYHYYGNTFVRYWSHRHAFKMQSTFEMSSIVSLLKGLNLLTKQTIKSSIYYIGLCLFLKILSGSLWQ